ncbi:type I-E CRISPR-associated protein Cas5/CasD [Pontivivens nitratireducens]|uniref:type I-E CRISPR-associated protein Cas5/CasD n=1 Tax=Pontivivens nitratireducens TaxID=2758038 RepID=UPI00163A3077|nr:type I-E CRISPR-associated protein Cas5/CasD [Pontibrevibacter nitratireducens]
MRRELRPVVEAHLVFTLGATLAAMGDLAGQERRGSWNWPGRSAVIGLMGAALGIRRDGDFQALDALAIAVAEFETGTPMRDFHTVQTVPTAVVKFPQTRAAALRDAGDRVNTVLTQRDYRCDVLYGVAVRGAGLEVIAQALRHPVFTPYLGRKSCPLNTPLAPLIVEASSAVEALAHVQVPEWHAASVARLIHEEPGMGHGPELQRSARHDRASERDRWHFSSREVVTRTCAITPQVMA